MMTHPPSRCAAPTDDALMRDAAEHGVDDAFVEGSPARVSDEREMRAAEAAAAEAECCAAEAAVAEVDRRRRQPKRTEGSKPPARLGVVADLAEIGEPLAKKFKQKKDAVRLFSTEEYSVPLPAEMLGAAAASRVAAARGGKTVQPPRPAAQTLAFGSDLSDYQGLLYHDAEGRFYRVGELAWANFVESTPEGAAAAAKGEKLKNQRRNNANACARAAPTRGAHTLRSPLFPSPTLVAQMASAASAAWASSRRSTRRDRRRWCAPRPPRARRPPRAIACAARSRRRPTAFDGRRLCGRCCCRSSSRRTSSTSTACRATTSCPCRCAAACGSPAAAT